jgi:hypothetical protein
VQGEWSDDVWKIRQELMMKAPYLSQDVLIEVAKENLLPILKPISLIATIYTVSKNLSMP